MADDYLSPGWVDYNKKMPFVRYDITSLIKKQNAIGIVLGDGWAVGHVGSNTTFKRTSYSDQIELSAQIKLEHGDCSIEYINTGSDQKLICGFLGVRFLLPALCDLGMTDVAYHLITNTDYPGWGYSVINGATTITGLF